MVLYYIDNEIYLDFKTIKERVSIPETTLYRLIIKSKLEGVRYRNLLLWNYKDLLIELPDVFKRIQEYETHK
jgi:hypothetical protein